MGVLHRVIMELEYYGSLCLVVLEICTYYEKQQEYDCYEVLKKLEKLSLNTEMELLPRKNHTIYVLMLKPVTCMAYQNT